MKKAQVDFFLLNGCTGWTGGSNGQSCGANTAAQKKTRKRGNDALGPTGEPNPHSAPFNEINRANLMLNS
jgi:hypothetical protein